MKCSVHVVRLKCVFYTQQTIYPPTHPTCLNVEYAHLVARLHLAIASVNIHISVYAAKYMINMIYINKRLIPKSIFNIWSSTKPVCEYKLTLINR